MGNYWLLTSRLKFMKSTTSCVLIYSLSILFFISTLLALLNTSASTSTSTSTTPCLVSVFRCQMAGKADFLSQVFEKTLGKRKTNDGDGKVEGLPKSLARTRRILIGLGSSPPRCNWKCGRCTPCKPVHVPVPPGTPVTTEYYPEAWRCKCGNKLYMP